MNSHPLSWALPGQRLKIVAIPKKQTRMRLLSLGFVPGTKCTLLWKRAGAVIVGRDSDRIAIGQSLAEQILVEEAKSA
jgi:Fe2+ transport system protein FeoA